MVDRGVLKPLWSPVSGAAPHRARRIPRPGQSPDRVAETERRQGEPPVALAARGSHLRTPPDRKAPCGHRPHRAILGAARELMDKLQRTIKAVIRPGEQSGYVAECVEVPVVTQGATLDEVTRNLQEAIGLHLEGEDLNTLGLAPHPTVIVTMELTPANA